MHVYVYVYVSVIIGKSQKMNTHIYKVDVCAKIYWGNKNRLSDMIYQYIQNNVQHLWQKNIYSLERFLC